MAIYDYGRPPQYWLLAIDIASRDLTYCESSENANDVYHWMEANDFDIAFVRGNSPLIVYRDQLKAAARDDSMARFVQPLPAEATQSATLSMDEAFRIFEQRSWFVLRQGNDIAGVVTRDDVAKPAACAFVLAHLITLERVLRRLLGTYTNRPMADEPNVAIGSEGKGDDDIFYLSKLVNSIEKQPVLLQELRLTRRQFKNRAKWAVKFRTHLAHARRLDRDHPGDRISFVRFRCVQSLMLKAIELVEDRPQIWRAIGDSVILDVAHNKIYAGPDAVPLPMDPPAFVITAANPYEQMMTEPENEYRNQMLKAVLLRHTDVVLPVVGQSACGQWKENSFMISNIDEREILNIAERFGQRAIFKLTATEKLVIACDGSVKCGASRVESEKIFED